MRSAAGCQRNSKMVLSTIFVVLDLPVRVIPNGAVFWPGFRLQAEEHAAGR
jgi:hypothetical protein